MRRRIPILIVLVLAAALAPAAPGAAAGSFTFYGSGFGHGLGMSQWGAYGLALQGWDYSKILTHFFTGTKVAKAGNPPTTLRVGLTQARVKIQLEAEAGPVTLRVENRRDGPLVGTIHRGTTWIVRAEGARYRVLDENGDQVGGRDWGGPNRNLYATYADAGARVKVPEGGATYNRGYLEFNLYGCTGGSCVERLILPIAPEQYLYGLGEVPSSWPMQALQAQAIAGRSYAFVKAGIGQHRNPCNCAIYDTSVDQVYAGWNKEGGADGNRWVAAVNRTAGQVVEFQGTTVSAFYASSDGGHTENNENVWGGSPIPWLRGVCDPGDYTAANPNAVWRDAFSVSSVSDRLRPYTGSIGTVQSFGDIVRGVSGRIVTAKVVGSTGSAAISGLQLEAALGLHDDRVWINRNRNVTGPIRTKYDGVMCRPGLPTTSQVSVQGGTRQKFEVGAIYHNAGASVTVWLKSAIYAEYTAIGGVDGRLGLPAAQVMLVKGPAGCGGGNCKRAVFDAGRIYWKSGIGAHALWGPVLKKYLHQNGAMGSLGFPTSRVTSSGGTARATFEHGTITCPRGAACTVS